MPTVERVSASTISRVPSGSDSEARDPEWVALLIRGAKSIADGPIEELADAEVRSAAVYYATQLSFFSAVTVALHEGPVDWGDPTHGKQLWPPAVKDPDALRTV